jgi:hypothetical protein
LLRIDLILRLNCSYTCGPLYVAPHRIIIPSHDFRPLLQPEDDNERYRLNLQHEQYYRIVGGLYAPVELVRNALAPYPEPSLYRRSILDVGTGSGIWYVSQIRGEPSELMRLQGDPYGQRIPPR